MKQFFINLINKIKCLDRKKMLPIFATLIATIAIGITMLLLNQQQDIRQSAAGQAKLVLSTNNSNLYVGDFAYVDLVLEAGATQVTAVDVTLAYDTSIFTYQKIVTSEELVSVFKENMEIPGRIRYVGIAKNDAPKSGSIKIATIVLSTQAQSVKPEGIIHSSSLGFTDAQVTEMGNIQLLPVELTKLDLSIKEILPTPTQYITQMSPTPAQMSPTPIPDYIPTPTPSPITCYPAKVSNIEYVQSCGFFYSGKRGATVFCDNGYKGSIGNKSSCSNTSDLKKEANTMCSSLCILPTIAPQPTIIINPTQTEKTGYAQIEVTPFGGMKYRIIDAVTNKLIHEGSLHKATVSMPSGNYYLSYTYKALGKRFSTSKSVKFVIEAGKTTQININSINGNSSVKYQ